MRRTGRTERDEDRARHTRHRNAVAVPSPRRWTWSSPGGASRGARGDRRARAERGGAARCTSPILPPSPLCRDRRALRKLDLLFNNAVRRRAGVPLEDLSSSACSTQPGNTAPSLPADDRRSPAAAGIAFNGSSSSLLRPRHGNDDENPRRSDGRAYDIAPRPDRHRQRGDRHDPGGGRQGRAAAGRKRVAPPRPRTSAQAVRVHGRSDACAQRPVADPWRPNHRSLGNASTAFSRLRLSSVCFG